MKLNDKCIEPPHFMLLQDVINETYHLTLQAPKRRRQNLRLQNFQELFYPAVSYR